MTLHNALDGNSSLDSYNLLRICDVPGIMYDKYFVYHVLILLNHRFIQLTNVYSLFTMCQMLCMVLVYSSEQKSWFLFLCSSSEKYLYYSRFTNKKQKI